MEEFEIKALANLSNPPSVWWRYVDDTFVVINRKELDRFHEFLNTTDPMIKFSLEAQWSCGTLPYLDCLDT